MRARKTERPKTGREAESGRANDGGLRDLRLKLNKRTAPIGMCIESILKYLAYIGSSFAFTAVGALEASGGGSGGSDASNSSLWLGDGEDGSRSR